MRRAERQVTDFAVIEELLRQGTVCHLAFPAQADEPPHVAMVNYGYADGALFIHGATEGRKAELLRQGGDVRVSIVVESSIETADTPCGWTCRFSSITARGSATVAQSEDQAREFLEALMAHYTQGPFEFAPKALENTMAVRIALSDIICKSNVK